MENYFKNDHHDWDYCLTVLWLSIMFYAFQVIAGLWVLSIVGSWCNFLTLLYISKYSEVFCLPNVCYIWCGTSFGNDCWSFLFRLNSFCSAAHCACSVWEVWTQGWPAGREGNNWGEKAVWSVWCQGFDKGAWNFAEDQEDVESVAFCCALKALGLVAELPIMFKCLALLVDYICGFSFMI